MPDKSPTDSKEKSDEEKKTKEEKEDKEDSSKEKSKKSSHQKKHKSSKKSNDDDDDDSKRKARKHKARKSSKDYDEDSNDEDDDYEESEEERPRHNKHQKRGHGSLGVDRYQSQVAYPQIGFGGFGLPMPNNNMIQPYFQAPNNLQTSKMSQNQQPGGQVNPNQLILPMLMMMLSNMVKLNLAIASQIKAHGGVPDMDTHHLMNSMLLNNLQNFANHPQSASAMGGLSPLLSNILGSHGGQGSMGSFPMNQNSNQMMNGLHNQMLGGNPNPLLGNNFNPMVGGNPNPLMGNNFNPMMGQNPNPLMGNNFNPMMGGSSNPHMGNGFNPMPGSGNFGGFKGFT